MPAMVDWLKENVGHYDTVIEIGANVGIFTVYLDKLSALSGSQLKNIYAFEPSPEAYRRLSANLLVNDSKVVTAIPAAVADRTGLLPFYEPRHLTNGSLNRWFAEMFCHDISEISERTVFAIAAADLDPLFKGCVLLKIDVEGYEPTLLKALSGVIDAHKPDIIIEVLKQTAENIEATDCLAQYKRFLLTNPPKLHPKIIFYPNNYDWLLIPAARPNQPPQPPS
jgi:FkbM family methyltransferase